MITTEVQIDPSHFGQAVSAIRRKRGLSQNDLARDTDLTVTAISRIERGYVLNPSLDVARRIAAGLEVTIDYMLSPEALT